MTTNFAKNVPQAHARQAEVSALAATETQPRNCRASLRDATRLRSCFPERYPELACDSDPTTHLAFVLQVGLTEFRGEISLLAKDHAVMKNQDELDDKEQRNPVVKKKSERDLQ